MLEPENSCERRGFTTINKKTKRESKNDEKINFPKFNFMESIESGLSLKRRFDGCEHGFDGCDGLGGLRGFGGFNKLSRFGGFSGFGRLW